MEVYKLEPKKVWERPKEYTISFDGKEAVKVSADSFNALENFFKNT